MEDKGQISVEYLLTVVVFLLILSLVTLPMVGRSINDTMDISNSADVEKSLNSIANAVNIVYANGPGAKRTISVYMPSTQILTFNSTNKEISTIVPLNRPFEGGDKTITATVHHNVTISPASFNKGWHTVTVEWTTDNITISH